MKELIDSDVWIGRVHVIPCAGSDPFPYAQAIGAYTNCITKAVSEIEFKGKVKSLLEGYNFVVTDFYDVEKLSERASTIRENNQGESLTVILTAMEGIDLVEEVAMTDIHTYNEDFGNN